MQPQVPCWQAAVVHAAGQAGQSAVCWQLGPGSASCWQQRVGLRQSRLVIEPSGMVVAQNRA
jgi:hypothetical protein